jgi:hypothetical protein
VAKTQDSTNANGRFNTPMTASGKNATHTAKQPNAAAA